MDLLDLLRRPEGKTLELKRDLSSPENVLRTLVAFANSAGGVVLIGVEDRTRRVGGVEDVLANEERLASLVSDSIAPRLLPEIEILAWRRKHVLGIEVHPGPSGPYYLKSQGPERGVLVRVGSTNRQADQALIAELRRSAAGRSFDEQPRPDLGSEAIDFQAASDLFRPLRRLRREDLHALHVMAHYQGREVPTNGGILLFGTARLRHFPDAWVQAGRFAGSDRRRILDSVAIRGSLAAAVEEAMAFVRKHTAREFVIADLRRAESWTLPLAAVREAIVNAVMHADYSQMGSAIQVAVFDDRLEVQSPGLLPLGMALDDVLRGVSKLRNRVLGRVFHELGLCESWGSGVPRMVESCRDAGLTDPRFEEVGTHFRVTLSALRHGGGGGVLAAKDEVILAALEEGDGLTTAEIAVRIALSTRATRTRLAHLVERGLVAEIGSGSQDPRRHYVLVPRAGGYATASRPKRPAGHGLVAEGGRGRRPRPPKPS